LERLIKIFFIASLLISYLIIGGCQENSQGKTMTELPEKTTIPAENPAEDLLSMDEDPITQLGSDNYYIAHYAEKKILEDSSADISTLIYEMEKNEKPQIREACARILGDKGDRTALSHLMGAVDEEDENVRYEIISSIGDFRDRASIETLIKVLLNDPCAKIRAEAAYALGETGDKEALWSLIEATGDKDEKVREWTAYSLGKLKDKTATGKLILLMEEDSCEKVRSNAAWALGSTGDMEATEPLIKAMKNDSSPRVRANAAYALGIIGEVWAVDPLIITLEEDKDDQVRANAAHALGQLQNYRAIESLLKTLEKDEDPLVRQQAAYALGWIDDREALEGLKKALKDPAPEVRAWVAYSLGELGDKNTIDLLQEALAIEEDETAQKNMNEAIKKIKSLH